MLIAEPSTWWVYIIYSCAIDKYYVGQTDNFSKRLQSHLEGLSSYTSRAKDWKLVYHEVFENRTAARKRELQIKRMKSRLYIEQLIDQGNGADSGGMGALRPDASG